MHKTFGYLAALVGACVVVAQHDAAFARAPAKPAHGPQAAGSTAPKRIGKWEDWQAATHLESGQPVCYAFSRPSNSAPALPGRGDVVLTVTQRGGGREAVALSAGFAYAQNAEVDMGVEGVNLPFYTSGRSAFARDGRATTQMFIKALQAQARSPGPHGQTVTDTFSLRGFSQAYAAIMKACPTS